MLTGCGSAGTTTPEPTASPPALAAPGASTSAAPGAGSSAAPSKSAPAKPAPALPSPGNPAGKAAVPAEAKAVDTSKPDRVIGTGTPASCTSAAVVKAVAAGGRIT